MFSSLSESVVVKNIIIVNALVFVAVFFTPMSAFYGQLAMYYIDSPRFGFWQLLTHMFMHGGVWHLVLNMYGLFLFGTILERVWGTQKFLFYYFATGFGAAFLYLLVEGLKYKVNLDTFFPFTAGYNIPSIPVVGASGAVFGVLIAFAMLFPNTELYLLFIPFPIKAKYLIGGYVAYELFRGLQFSPDSQIAHFAHLGGALFGFLIVKFWQRNQKTFY
jgi:membrane associated rhomboid family serine protease